MRDYLFDFLFATRRKYIKIKMLKDLEMAQLDGN